MFVCSRSACLLSLAVYSCIILNHLTSGQANYCTIPSCSARQHTLCRYSSTTPAAACANYKVSGLLTTDDIQVIVKKHNELRERVATGGETSGNPGPQPSASNMKILSWDPELAQIAQRWADQCSDNHDACRNVDRFQVGQNIASMSSTAPVTESTEQFIQWWFDEVSQFSKDGVTEYEFESSTGHYTQLVWANSSYVGCGRVVYLDKAIHMNTMRLICNYGPAGNFIGQSVYLIGKPGSACTNGTSVSSPNLCN